MSYYKKSKAPTALPPEAAFDKNIYTVETKPIGNFYAKFGADTLPEIEEWLNTNAEWAFTSTIEHQVRVASNAKHNPLIITKMAQRSNENGDGWVMRRSEDFDSRSLFRRQTPKAVA